MKDGVMREPTLLSLFDGSGGFPLAASLCGIRPVACSEIEPYPIAVTRSRFPNMKHLGSVTEIHGGEIEPVDIITFGAPCQDLSVAGKRAGLKHTDRGDEETTRSGLFMEAVRIIKEMREATHGEYPKFCIYENVPGLFSCSKGQDFRAVLEELIKIVEPTAVMPEVPKDGWAYADSFRGDGWSIAWRVLDAQYIRTAQRRRRVYLVLDLGGQRAREVLFERESLRGDFAESGTPGQGTPADAESGAGADDRAGERVNRCILDDQGDSQINVRTDGKSPTLRAEMHGNVPCVIEAAGFKAGQSMAGSIGWQEECAATLAANCSGTEPSVCISESAGFCPEQSAKTRGIGYEDEMAPTLRAGVTPGVCIGVYRKGTRPHSKEEAQKWEEADKSNTLNTFDTGESRASELVVERHSFENHSQDARYKAPLDVCPMLSAQMGTGGNNQPLVLCMAHGQANAEILEDKSPCLNCNHEQPIVFDKEVYNSGKNAAGGHYIAEGGPAPTLRGTGHTPGMCVRYIVRRLTPTECARLQGFPDRWGDIDPKEDFSDEEYRFWLEVRNTHAAINGKTVKDHTKKQMLTWYNKLHTDSAEYKMYGNGITLPCALYVMQGIQDALDAESCFPCGLEGIKEADHDG